MQLACPAGVGLHAASASLMRRLHGRGEPSRVLRGEPVVELSEWTTAGKHSDLKGTAIYIAVQSTCVYSRTSSPK